MVSGAHQPDDRALLDVLAAVPDPEIPVVSVVDLGIVRGIARSQNGQAEVLVTPTYTGCPATEVITRSIRAALDQAGYGAVAIRSLLSPPWSTDMISAEGRAKLLAYGIAPPTPATTPAGDHDPAPCPRCGSTDTREVSRFGSTPCKALWQCQSCLEPFDRFKCH